MFGEIFSDFAPLPRGIHPYSAQFFALPGRIPSCRYFGVRSATGCAAARAGGRGGKRRPRRHGAGQGAAHADTLAGGWRAGRGGAAGKKGGQCRQAPWGRGEGHERERKGKAARVGSGSGGRQKNSEKSSAGRLATGSRIAYLCSRGEEAAMARPAPATKKAPMPPAPRRPAGRGGARRQNN